MTIIDELLSTLKDDAPVRSVLVGVYWTAVCSRGCGLASTLMDDKPHGHDPVRDAGCLHLKTARQLAEYARSVHLLEASIGVAALNSLLEVDERGAIEVNAADLLATRSQGKTVALVGHFPFIPRLRAAVGRLWVLELHPAQGEFPPEAAAELLPQADLVAITGSALINHTLDGLLALCRPDSLVMVLGPSTPLSPVLFEHGVCLLSGVRVSDEAAVLRAIGQGANFRQVEGVRLITMAKKGFEHLAL